MVPTEAMNFKQAHCQQGRRCALSSLVVRRLQWLQVLLALLVLSVCGAFISKMMLGACCLVLDALVVRGAGKERLELRQLIQA